MKSLKEYIIEATKNKVAIGHFNVSTLDGIWAVADAAKELDVPVIIGLSEGERDYVGVNEAVAIVKSIREKRDQPIFLNADHTYSFDRVKEAIDAGFDAVIFDGAQLPLEENIRITKMCVDYAKQKVEGAKGLKGEGGDDLLSPSRSHALTPLVLIEGELGFIGTSSKVLDAIPTGAVVGNDAMTKPEDAFRFVNETGIDLLAPAVGNIHGVVIGGDPALNSERVKDISNTISIPLVLHGASGNTADDIRKCIANGVSIVHVNTELRLAYRSGLMKSLSDNSDEIAPYKYLKPAKLAMQKVVVDKLKILNCI